MLSRSVEPERWVGWVVTLGVGLPLLPAVLVVYALAGWGVIQFALDLFTTGGILRIAGAVLLVVGGLTAAGISLFTMIWYLPLPARCLNRLREATNRHAWPVATVGVVAAVATSAILAFLLIGWVRWDSPWRWVALAAATAEAWGYAIASLVRGGKTGLAW